jgi:hypothetical protein
VLDQDATQPVHDVLVLHDQRGLDADGDFSPYDKRLDAKKRIRSISGGHDKEDASKISTENGAPMAGSGSGSGSGTSRPNKPKYGYKSSGKETATPQRKKAGNRVRGISTSSVGSAASIGSGEDDAEFDEIHTTAAEDAEEFELLCPEELEEAADVLVGSVPWLEEDIVVFVRLKNTIDLRIERHAPARFFAVILGPPKDEDCVRHIEMAEGLAMLLQDEEVVEVRCSFSDRILHSRMPLDPTLVHLKRTCA